MLRVLLRSHRIWILVGLAAAIFWLVRRDRLDRQEIPHQVVISELMAFNTWTLLDEDGDSSDWIELMNRGESTADLTGFSLTDDMRVARKWPLPEIVLEPGESTIIFASGKDRREGELHTNFQLNEEGEFLGLVAPHGTLVFGYPPQYPPQRPNTSFGLASGAQVLTLAGQDSVVRAWVPHDRRYDSAWTEPGFDDGAWVLGRGGVGFETGYKYTRLIGVPLEDMHRRTASAYVRIPFQVPDPDSVKRLVLRLKYDDGFVAFLNGERVAAAGAPRRLSWRSRATQSRPDEEALVWREFDLEEGRRGLVQGSNLLAIHGLNRSPGSADFLMVPVLEALVGDPGLTDETVFLSTPTPGQINSTGYESQAPPPSLSVASGLFFEPVEVALLASPGGTVRYTLDGTLPIRSSSLYKEPLILRQSTYLRARQFLDGQVPSQPASGRYVVVDPELADFDSNLPIVLVETFGQTVSANRFDPAYVRIFAGDARNSVDSPGAAGIAVEASVKHRGSISLRYPKKSFAIEIQDEVGRDRAVAVLGMPADSDWTLIAPYQYDRSLMRNAFLYELSQRMGRYAPRTRFVELFVHTGAGTVSYDDYQGVYVLTEKIKRGAGRVDVEEIAPSHRGEPGISGGYIVKIDRRDPGDRGFSAAGEDRFNYVYPKEALITEGQAQWIQRYLNEVGQLAQEGGYGDSIEVDSWIDYHILQEFSRNPDGHRLSTYLFKKRSGKLEMGPAWDFDRALGADSIQNTQHPPDPSPVGRSRVSYYGWWQHLLAHEDLKRRYRDRWVELRQGPFRISSLRALIDHMAGEIAEAQARNFARWPIGLGARGWEGKIDHLRTWTAVRARWMDAELIAAPALTPPGGPVTAGSRVEASPVLGGEIFYTTDGSDPLGDQGQPSAGAKPWPGGLLIHEDTVLSLRERVAEDVWGAAGRWELRAAD